MTERSGYHVSYDDAGSVQIDEATHAPMAGDDVPVSQDGLGCHSGSTMKEAAREAGQSELLDQFAKDYPQGPHDQPQSMCPAFGSLRVGLRMKRVATLLSGSAWLRLWADVCVAFLWGAAVGWLCAVQF